MGRLIVVGKWLWNVPVCLIGLAQTFLFFVSALGRAHRYWADLADPIFGLSRWLSPIIDLFLCGWNILALTLAALTPFWGVCSKRSRLFFLLLAAPTWPYLLWDHWDRHRVFGSGGFGIDSGEWWFTYFAIAWPIIFVGCGYPELFRRLGKKVLCIRLSTIVASKRAKWLLSTAGFAIVAFVSGAWLLPPPIEGIYEMSSFGGALRCYRGGRIYDCDPDKMTAIHVARYFWSNDENRWLHTSEFNDELHFWSEPGWLGMTEHGVKGRFVFYRRTIHHWSNFVVVVDHKTPKERFNTLVDELQKSSDVIILEPNPGADATKETNDCEIR